MAKSENLIKTLAMRLTTHGAVDSRQSQATSHWPLATILCLLLALPAVSFATKLDLSSDVNVKTANYTNLITGNERLGVQVYSEHTSLGFIIKDIKLEKTENSYMDVGVVLNSIGNGASTNTLAAPQFSAAAARYPNTDGTPFIKEAYIKVYKFLNPRTTLTAGRQAFTLGQGITLADDGLGLPGVRIESDKLWKNLKGEFFFFRPFNITDDVTVPGKYVKVIGAGIYYPSNEGFWHLSHFWEQSDQPMIELGHSGQSVSRTKKFTGIRYFLNHKQLNFDGEFIIQRGTSKEIIGNTAKTVNYNAYAFLIKGVWDQDIIFFGPSKMRLAYGKSSGNSGPVDNKDKAFLPTFGHRFNGLERDGFGEIVGASLYDIIQTSTGTFIGGKTTNGNGMPTGLSGLNVINLGADMPYKKLALSVDFYRFKASQSVSQGKVQIGSEWDLKAAYPMGEGLRLKAVYAVFRPANLYLKTKSIDLISLSVTAKF